jgi:hypothetical protein
MRALVGVLRAESGEQGDTRADAFAGAFERVESWRQVHERAGGVPKQALDEIDRVVQEAAGRAVTGRSNEEVVALLGRIDLLLTGPDSWIRYGWANPDAP